MRWGVLCARAIVACGATMVLVACSLVVDTDGLTGGSGTSGAAGDSGATADVTSSDATPACAAPSTCVSTLPGFSGPYAVMLPGAGALECAAPFVRDWQRLGGVDPTAAKPAECTCGCRAFSGTCTVTLSMFSKGECAGSSDKKVLSVGPCTETDNADGFRAAGVVSASCPVDATSRIPALGATPIAVGCAAPPGSGSCATGGMCVPPLPSGARLCVRPNDSAASCPAEYAQEVALPAGVDDTRACTPCACAATGTSCSYSYKLFDDRECAGVGFEFSDTGCHAPFSIDAVKLISASATGTCTPSGGVPSGAVTAQPASKICCRP